MDKEMTTSAQADTPGNLDSKNDTAQSLNSSTSAGSVSRDEILRDALDLINGDRADDYGDAATNFNRIANGWNLILTDALRTHGRIMPAHVALMMDWVKTSRLLVSLDHKDSWIDKAGYTALGGEVANDG